jgi:hypothetical protein
MAFIEESTGYEKTVLSDLQGTWNALRACLKIIPEADLPSAI